MLSLQDNEIEAFIATDVDIDKLKLDRFRLYFVFEIETDCPIRALVDDNTWVEVTPQQEKVDWN